MAGRRLAAALLVILTACGGDGDTTGPTPTPVASDVVIAPTTFDLELGETLQLEATVRDASGNLLTGRTVTWSSSDENVATVSAAGVVTGTGGGAATISATVDSQTDEVAGSVLPYRVAQNAFPVDSLELELVSDRAEMDAGTYRFNYIGAGTQPTFQVGDVIVGAQGLGFLRKVTSVSVAGTEITLETDPALLDDLIDEGEFGFNVDLFTGAGVQGAPGAGSDRIDGLGPDRVKVTYGDPWVRTPEGVVANVSSSSGFGISFDGFDVCKFFKDNDPSNACPSPIDEFKFPNGTTTFSPSFDFGSTKNADGEYTEFHGIARGQFDQNISVSLGAKVGQSYTSPTATIFEFGRIVYILVGSIPVLVHAEMEIKAKFEASLSVKGKLQAGLTAQHTVDVGARWDDQQGWQGVLTGSGSFTPQQPSIDDSTAVASITLDAKATLTPNLNLKFYGVAGPLVGLEPFLKANMTASTTTCGFKAEAGVDGKVGIALADILSETLNNPNFSQTTNLATMPLAQWQCPVGDANVSIATGGSDPDPDGYTLEIDGVDQGAIGTDESRIFGNLREGSREFALKGLADNCEVQGSNPVSTTITIGQSANVSFQVQCRATGGAPGTVGHLEVTTATSGQLIDPDGYQISVDGNSRAAGTNEVLTFSDLSPGSYTASISGLAPNCAAGSTSQQVTVVADAIEQVTFFVQCAGGELDVSTTTTGTPPQDHTLGVSVDGEYKGVIDFDEQKTFTMEVGQHDVTLEGLPSHCTLSGANPAQVTVPDNGTGTAAFTLDCPPGQLTVNASTIGDNGGVTSYRVVVDGTNMQTVLADGGSTVFADLSNGAHTVELLDAPSQCTVLGQNPRNVTVPGVADMGVDCSGGGKIVFEQRFSNETLYFMNPDGTQVEEAPGRGDAPRWHPDGTQYVTSTSCVPPEGLIVWEADGSGQRAVLSNACGTNPGFREASWSPDGGQMMVRADSQNTQRLFIVNVAAGSRLLAYEPAVDSIWQPADPDWAPNGTDVLFTSWDKDFIGYNIYSMPTGGGTPTLVLGTESVFHRAPRYSPDGTRVAFYRVPFETPDYEIVIVRRSDLAVLTVIPLGTGQECEGQISWSPDGTRIVYDFQPTGGAAGLYLVNDDGTGNVKLRDNVCSADWQPN